MLLNLILISVAAYQCTCLFFPHMPSMLRVQSRPFICCKFPFPNIIRPFSYTHIRISTLWRKPLRLHFVSNKHLFKQNFGRPFPESMKFLRESSSQTLRVTRFCRLLPSVSFLLTLYYDLLKAFLLISSRTILIDGQTGIFGVNNLTISQADILSFSHKPVVQVRQGTVLQIGRIESIF